MSISKTSLLISTWYLLYNWGLTYRMITSYWKCEKTGWKSHCHPSCFSSHPYIHKIIHLEKLETKKSLDKHTIPILKEEPCKMTNDTQSHSKKKSSIDFLGGIFMWHQVEMRIRKGKTCTRHYTRERQDKNLLYPGTFNKMHTPWTMNNMPFLKNGLFFFVYKCF
jgi:hypothetical protein